MSKADKLYGNSPTFVRDDATGKVVVRRPPKVEEQPPPAQTGAK